HFIPLRIYLSDLLNLPNQIEKVGRSLSINVRISGIGSVRDGCCPGLRSELECGGQQQCPSRQPRQRAPSDFNEDDGTHAGQQDHSMPKAQEAPGSFICDETVSSHKQQTVKSQESNKAGVGIGSSLSDECCQNGNYGQGENQPFTPNRAAP